MVNHIFNIFRISHRKFTNTAAKAQRGSQTAKFKNFRWFTLNLLFGLHPTLQIFTCARKKKTIFTRLCWTKLQKLNELLFKMLKIFQFINSKVIISGIGFSETILLLSCGHNQKTTFIHELGNVWKFIYLLKISL